MRFGDHDHPADRPAPAPGPELDHWVRQYFREHSRTFSLATRLLPARVRQPVAVVYWYCRTIDNIADERSLELGTPAALERLNHAEEALDRCLAGQPDPEPLWLALAAVHASWSLPRRPMFELIEGARWDLESRTVATMGDLVSYSQLVAGSIGEMMLPFLVDLEAPRSPGLVTSARELGVAMQITNILRDVGEDLDVLGRTYLPTEAWRALGLATGDRPEPRDPRYRALLESLMAEAEARYRLGLQGTGGLDRGVRLGIRAAARTYREILNEVRAAGYDNVTRRAVVSYPRKVARIVHDGYEARKRRLAPPDRACP